MISEVAALLSSGRRNVVCLTGAGISVAAGIPDFRSPGGMYDTLRPELLTASARERRMMEMDPTAVVSYELFRRNQFPYMEVRRPFIVGTGGKQWRPTLAHFFLRLLHDKGLLRRVYTQNIDGLDFHVGLPEDIVVPVHGSIAQVLCEACGEPESLSCFIDKVKRNIKDIYSIDPDAPSQSSNIYCVACGQPALKPATVLYGRHLPKVFFDLSPKDCQDCHILFVMGTSLTVHPAASLPDMVPMEAARVLVNRDAVLHPARPGDTHLSGDCDEVLLALALELNWGSELMQYREEMAASSRTLLEKRLLT